MAWFRRKKGNPAANTPDSTDRSDQVMAFWAWWRHEGARRAADAIVDKDPGQVYDLLSRALEQVHPALSWELGPGRGDSDHLLAVSAGPGSELEPVVRQWLLAAPAADQTWCFGGTVGGEPVAGADQAAPGPAEQPGWAAPATAAPDSAALAADPQPPVAPLPPLSTQVPPAPLPPIDATLTVVAATVDGARVNICFYHPDLEGLDRAQRRRLSAQVLVAAFGDSRLDPWIGLVEPVDQPPTRSIALEQLRALVERVAAGHPLTGPDRVWRATRGEDADGAFFVRHIQPLSAAGRPDLDTHVRMVVPYAAHGPSGFYDPPTGSRLATLEAELEESLDETGQLVASENRPGRRVLHFYVDGTTAASAVLQKDRDWAAGPISCDVLPDPLWESVAHLRDR